MFTPVTNIFYRQHFPRLARDAVITDTETPYDTDADLTDADAGFTSIISVDGEGVEEDKNAQEDSKEKAKRMSSARNRSDLDVSVY